MDYELDTEHIDTDNYRGSCEACSAVVMIDGETDNQMGRCGACGYHPNDDEFHANPFVPLDFNDD